MLVMAMMLGSVASAAGPSSTEVIVPELTGRAVFNSKTANISEAEKIKITAALDSLEKDSKVAMVVLVIDSVEPFAIEEYSIKVAEKWKIGKEKVDNGILLVIAAKDRKTRIEVGYGMEGVITDAMSNRIINEYMIPRFKNELWSDGIIEAIGRVGNLVNEKPLDTALAPVFATAAVSAAATKTKSSSSSFNTSSLKGLDGEALIIALVVLAFMALFTTGIGKVVLIGVVIGGVVSMSKNKFGSIVSGVLGGSASGLAGYLLVDSWWIIAVAVGSLCGAFGIRWTLDILEILLHVVANSKGGSSSSSRSGGYSGGGGRFGGGGSSGSW